MQMPHNKTLSSRMQISLLTMFGFVLPTALALWGVGAWPAWRWAGSDGLVAHTAAGGIVLTVMVASAAAVRVFAARGPAKAAFAFIAAGMVRIMLCLVITAGALPLFALPLSVLCISTPLFYIATLIAEGLWLGRALNHDAHRVALGEIRSPARLLPSDLPAPPPPAHRTEEHCDTRQ